MTTNTNGHGLKPEELVIALLREPEKWEYQAPVSDWLGFASRVSPDLAWHLLTDIATGEANWSFRRKPDPSSWESLKLGMLCVVTPDHDKSRSFLVVHSVVEGGVNTFVSGNSCGTIVQWQYARPLTLAEWRELGAPVANNTKED